MTRRNHRAQTIADTITDRVRSHRGFISNMRGADEALDSARSAIDDSAGHDRQLRAIDRCLTDLERYSPEDINHVAAR